MSSADTVRPMLHSPATAIQRSPLTDHHPDSPPLERYTDDKQPPPPPAPRNPPDPATPDRLEPAPGGRARGVPSQAGSTAPSVRAFSRTAVTPPAPPRQPKPLVRPIPPRPPAQTRGSSCNMSARTASSGARRLSAGNLLQQPSSSSTAAGSPPHSHQALSAMQGPTVDELIKFSALCRTLYYAQDPSAARQIEAVTQKLPLSSRQAYARAMAAVRAQFHRDEAHRRRRETEQALAEAAAPLGGPGSAALQSKRSRQMRREALEAFVGTYGGRGMPGPHPFLRALHAALSLQALDPSFGGPGRRRVEWEVDVAIFSEAAGGEWMRDSVHLLKTVLGFDERVKQQERTSFLAAEQEDVDEEAVLVGESALAEDDDDSDEEQQQVPSANGVHGHSPLASGVEATAATVPVRTGSVNKREPPAVPPHRNSSKSSHPSRAASADVTGTADHLRERSISDPFLDPADRKRPVPQTAVLGEGPLAPHTPPPLPPRHPSPSNSASASSAALLEPGANDSTASLAAEAAVSPSLPSTAAVGPNAALEPAPQYRVFTVPGWLTDPEIKSLLAVFPDCAQSSKAAVIRLAAATSAAANTSAAKADEESVAGGAGGALSRTNSLASSVKVAQRGHGEITVSEAALREERWRGSAWDRFVAWLWSLFGRG